MFQYFHRFYSISVKDLQALGATETKLLYTLHWILLFASAECADDEAEAKRNLSKEPDRYLFSIPTISVRNADSIYIYQIFHTFISPLINEPFDYF